MKKEKLYFLVQYSEDGTNAKRITGLYSYPIIEQKASLYDSIEQSFLEIENTEDDYYHLASVDIDKWVHLPKPRF